jgi:hypothetical protein
MIDWLRALWDRPIRDSERVPLFIVSATVLVGAALLLAFVGHEDPVPRSASVEPVRADPAAELEPPPPVDGEDDGEAPPPASVAVDPDELRRAQRVARRFLAVYLPYSYGGGSLRGMGASASPELRAELAAEPPRVPEGRDGASPRVRSMQAELATGRSMAVLAVVADGRRTYSLSLALERVAGDWRVTGLGG